MAKYRRISIALSLALGLACAQAFAQESADRPPDSDPAWGLCAQMAAKVEVEMGLPAHILTAVSLAETGWAGPNHQVWTWPWTVHDGTRGYHLDSKADAVDFVRDLRAGGRRSIDVGCMQVNLFHHPRAFTSVTESFDPESNIRYAASFLKELALDSGSWEEAIAKYHTQNPAIDEDYAPRVLAFWARERLRAADAAPARRMQVASTAQAKTAAGFSATTAVLRGAQASPLILASATPSLALRALPSDSSPGPAVPQADSSAQPLVLQRSFASTP